MIKLKINELSESGAQPNGSITNKKNTSKVSSKDEVLNYFKEIKDDSDSDEELKQEAVWFIHLIEQLHWGESEEIKDIQIDLNKAFKSRFEITIITGVINKLIKENRIIFLKGLKSPRSSLTNLLGLYIVLSATLSDKESFFLNKIAQENQTTTDLIKKAIKCVIQVSKDYPIQAIYNSVLKNSSSDKVDPQKMDQIITDFALSRERITQNT